MAVAGRKDLVDAVRSTYDPKNGLISVEVTPKDRSIADDSAKSATLKVKLAEGLPAKARDWPVSIVVLTSVTASGGSLLSPWIPAAPGFQLGT
jgi:hypothetical protein